MSISTVRERWMLILQTSAGFALLLIVLRIFYPTYFHFGIAYAKHIISIAKDDGLRQKAADKLLWSSEYRLHQMEMTYNMQLCLQDTSLSKKKYAWLTAMNNDKYVIGAIYLAYALQKLSCHNKKIALVSNGVTKVSQEALHRAGYDVRLVEALDCNWMDRKKGMNERNLGLPGTHMRFHAWNYTQYKEIIYLDPDVMPLHNIDIIFEMEAELAASYCSRPGLIDPCFNAGLIKFKPNTKKYNEIMDMWSQLSVGDACPNDQVLLWYYYADNYKWTPLPYAYNVRRHLYHPMKVYHFACCLTDKPWLVKGISRQTIDSFEGPLSEPIHMVILWWKHFNSALDEYSLHEWYKQIKDTI